jgi:mRNA interferase RelE/StbE
MAFKIVYRRDPVKVLRRVQPAKAGDITGAVERIAADPSAPNHNVKPLRGISNGFRVRVGDWRVSYTIDREARVIDVFEVAPRGGAYR